MDGTEQEIRDYVVESLLFGQAVELGPEDSFLEKGMIDSTGVIELVAFLEQKYGIQVHDDELLPDNLDSIANIRRYVASKLNPAAARQ